LSEAPTACPGEDRERVRWLSPMSRGRLFVTTIELHAGEAGFNSPFNRASETATPNPDPPAGFEVNRQRVEPTWKVSKNLSGFNRQTPFNLGFVIPKPQSVSKNQQIQIRRLPDGKTLPLSFQGA